jgi:hypothetical protein
MMADGCGSGFPGVTASSPQPSSPKEEREVVVGRSTKEGFAALL